MAIDPALIGKSFPAGPSYLVGREKLREFAAAVSATDPVHLHVDAAQAAGFPDLVATPTFAVLISQRATRPIYLDPRTGLDWSRVVHGGQEFVHHRPIHAGDEVLATVHFDRISPSGPNTLVTTRVELATTGGEPLTTATSTLVVRGERASAPGSPGRPGTPGGAGDRPAPTEESPGDSPPTPAQEKHPDRGVGLSIGSRMPARTVLIDRPRLVEYAGASLDRNRIHWDEAFAVEAGLPGVVAHGMLTMALAVGSAGDWLDAPVLRCGTRFVAPVVVPADSAAEIEISGEVRETDPDSGTVTVAVSATCLGDPVLGRAFAVIDVGAERLTPVARPRGPQEAG